MDITLIESTAQSELQTLLTVKDENIQKAVSFLSENKIDSDEKDEFANEIAVSLKTCKTDYETERKKVTSLFDELKKKLMQPEKDLQETLDLVQKARNEFASLKNEIATTDAKIHAEINKRVFAATMYFEKYIELRLLGEVEKNLNLKPVLKPTDFDKIVEGKKHTVTFEEASNLFEIKIKEVQERFKPIFENAKIAALANQEAKEEVKEQAQNLKEEVHMNQKIEEQLIAQTSAPVLPKGAKEVFTATFVDKGLKLDTIYKLIKFFVEKSLEKGKLDFNKAFEPFLNFAAKNGCPKIDGVVYNSEIHTQVRK